jgi:hypothetical protein
LEFTYTTLDKKEKTIDLPISLEEFKSIKRDVRGEDLYDLDDWVFWDIRDHLFQKLIIYNLKDEFLQFFVNVHTNAFELYESQSKQDIKVVDVYYHYYYNKIFVCAEPNDAIYPNYKAKRLEVGLGYDTEELESLLTQILNAFEVDYQEWIDDGEKFSENELEISTFFSHLMQDCWTESKANTNSSVIGMVFYATGGSAYVDLDNGTEVEQTDEGIRAYVKTRM